MARNTGKGFRKGAVRGKTQFQTPSGHYAKRDRETGQIEDVKTSEKEKFKGVAEEPDGRRGDSEA